MNSSNIQSRAAEIALNYYENTPKCKLIGKTSQKAECAKAVLQEVPLETLLAATAFRLRFNPKIVFFKYEVFKTFATPETAASINQHIASLIVDAISEYGSCEVHVDLSSFTVSAAERYRSIAEQYVDHCISLSIEMSENTTRMVIYNSPSFINTVCSIVKQFVPPGLKKRIEYYSRAESEPLIAALIATESAAERT